MVAMIGKRGFAPPQGRRSAKHQYRLMYYANTCGVEKRAELSAECISAALEFAMSDQSRRTVDIWEDGEFACRLQRDIPAIDVQH